MMKNEELMHCGLCGKTLVSKDNDDVDGKLIIIQDFNGKKKISKLVWFCSDCYKKQMKNTSIYFCSEFLKSVNSEFTDNEKKIIKENEELFRKVVDCTCARMYYKFKIKNNIEFAVIDSNEYLVTCILSDGVCTSDT